MADDTRQQELWTYAGIRVGTKGRKISAWQGPDGELMFFSKITGRAIGGQYTVKVNRSDAGEFQTVSPATLQFAGSRCDDAELIARWQTEHKLAEVTLTRDRQERKMRAEQDAFEKAIDPLRDLRAASCRTWSDRAAFIALVLEALSR